MRHEHLQLGMALDDARQDKPRRRDADVESTAERKVQSPVISIKNVDERVVGWMDEQRNSKLLDARIERLKARIIDMVVLADAARNVDADQAEPIDHTIEFIDSGLRVLQRHDTARPN